MGQLPIGDPLEPPSREGWLEVDTMLEYFARAIVLKPELRVAIEEARSQWLAAIGLQLNQETAWVNDSALLETQTGESAKRR